MSEKDFLLPTEHCRRSRTFVRMVLLFDAVAVRTSVAVVVVNEDGATRIEVETRFRLFVHLNRPDDSLGSGTKKRAHQRRLDGETV